jgi:protein O-mannosyl-transferase
MSKKKKAIHAIDESMLRKTTLPQWPKYFIFLFACLLYVNTLGHDYTQDDAIVIYDNMYTTQGISGIPGLLSKDTFFGFFKTEGKAKLVSGGRYRPATPVMFAVEYELFGKNPFYGHLMNVLWYALLGLMLFLLMSKIFVENAKDKQSILWFAMLTSMFFVAHPIHTEAVANIKGRDEIISLLGSLTAVWLLLKAEKNDTKKYSLLASVVFFIALLSKENAITFLVIAPLIFFMLCNMEVARILKKSLYLVVPAVLFLLIRTAILGFDFGGAPMELMNNPFLKLVNDSYVPFTGGEKLASILYTLGKYLLLLVFPHPLTNDYYPRHIDIMSFTDIGVMLSLAVHLVLGFLAVYFFKRNKIVSFSILYYFITLSLVSNILFPVGTNMSERFLFMPSLGFVLLLAYIIYKYLFRQGTANYTFFGVSAVILILFSFKTIDRNKVWKNDYTLFTTDVKVSENSAKALNAAGGAIITEHSTEENESLRNQKLREAVNYLGRALEVHPKYKAAALLKGNAHFYLEEYEEAIKSFNLALDLDPNYADARRNLSFAYREAGKFAGEKQNNLTKAKFYLEEAYKLDTTDFETLRLLGVLNGVQGNFKESERFLLKAIEIGGANRNLYQNLSSTYQNLGDQEKAAFYLQKAIEADGR